MSDYYNSKKINTSILQDIVANQNDVTLGTPGVSKSFAANENLDAFKQVEAFDQGVFIRSEILKFLNENSFNNFYEAIKHRIIGQEELIKVCANVYNYLNAVAHELPVQNNMILSAPSGSGKTETYRVIRDYFATKIPALQIYIYDVSQLTTAGFKGADPSDIVAPFMRTNFTDAIGIVFLDEFDKKMTPIMDAGGTNVNREVQSQLLTILEGGTIFSKSGNAVDTGNLMFVALGSFNEFRMDREVKKNPIGLGLNKEWERDETERDHFTVLTRENMMEAGASYEMLGRFPYIVNYERLSDDAIECIVQKVIDRVGYSFGLKSLEVTKKMFDELKKDANSKYGCRLIESNLRSIVLEAYSCALINAKNGQGSDDIRIKLLGNGEYFWEIEKPKKKRTSKTNFAQNEEESEYSC